MSTVFPASFFSIYRCSLFPCCHGFQRPVGSSKNQIKMHFCLFFCPSREAGHRYSSSGAHENSLDQSIIRTGSLQRPVSIRERPSSRSGSSLYSPACTDICARMFREYQASQSRLNFCTSALLIPVALLRRKIDMLYEFVITRALCGTHPCLTSCHPMQSGP